MTKMYLKGKVVVLRDGPLEVTMGRESTEYTMYNGEKAAVYSMGVQSVNFAIDANCCTRKINRHLMKKFTKGKSIDFVIKNGDTSFEFVFRGYITKINERYECGAEGYSDMFIEQQYWFEYSLEIDGQVELREPINWNEVINDG